MACNFSLLIILQTIPVHSILFVCRNHQLEYWVQLFCICYNGLIALISWTLLNWYTTTRSVALLIVLFGGLLCFLRLAYFGNVAFLFAYCFVKWTLIALMSISAFSAYREIITKALSFTFCILWNLLSPSIARLRSRSPSCFFFTES